MTRNGSNLNVWPHIFNCNCESIQSMCVLQYKIYLEKERNNNKNWKHDIIWCVSKWQATRPWMQIYADEAEISHIGSTSICFVLHTLKIIFEIDFFSINRFFHMISYLQGSKFDACERFRMWFTICEQFSTWYSVYNCASWTKIKLRQWNFIIFFKYAISGFQKCSLYRFYQKRSENDVFRTDNIQKWLRIFFK